MLLACEPEPESPTELEFDATGSRDAEADLKMINASTLLNVMAEGQNSEQWNHLIANESLWNETHPLKVYVSLSLILKHFMKYSYTSILAKTAKTYLNAVNRRT